MAQYIRINSDGSTTLLYTDKNISSSNTASKSITVGTVDELEAAVAAQTAGQYIQILPGTYNLTEELVPPILATNGGLIGIGGVEINGHDDADSAISIVGTAATATFEYKLKGNLTFKGGTDKIGLKMTNPDISQKTILYVQDRVHFEDNGSGIGFSMINTGTGAMRVYTDLALGTGWDSVLITTKNANDKYRFKGISFDEDFDATVVDVASNWLFENCQLKHTGMDGGHANNIVNVVSCYTIESTAVAVADASDFPNAFNPTII